MQKTIKNLLLSFIVAIPLYAQMEGCKDIKDNATLALRHDCQREEDLITIANALEKSFLSHFNYTQPEVIHLDTSIVKNHTWSTKSDLTRLQQDKLLSVLPIDPLNNDKYYYIYEPLNDLYHPYYQLCVSKLETTKLPYCITPKKHTFYSDHLFVTTRVSFKNNIHPLTIITANILYGGGSPTAPSEVSTLRRQASILKNAKPDVVLFQEVELYSHRTLTRDRMILKNNETAIDYFSRELNLPYHYFIKSSSLMLGKSGKLFLSKYPIVSHRKLDRHLTVIGIDINNDKKQDIILGNIHLKPKGLKGTHKKMIETSVKKLLLGYHEYPIVMGGDFFFHDLDLSSLNFIDTYVECGKKNEEGLKYTTTTIRKIPRRLDYLFTYGISCVKNTHRILY